jgi:hypothetical protein
LEFNVVKSSLLKRLAGQIVPPTSAELARRLAVAQAELSDFQAKHRELAADSLADVAGSAEALVDVKARIASARENVATLEDALTVTRDREAAATTKAKAEIRRSRLAACRKHSEDRTAAFAAMDKAAAEIVAGYATVISASAAMQAAWPDGEIQLPLLHAAELHHALRRAFDRYCTGALDEQRLPFASKGAFDSREFKSLAEQAHAEHDALFTAAGQ